MTGIEKEYLRYCFSNDIFGSIPRQKIAKIGVLNLGDPQFQCKSKDV